MLHPAEVETVDPVKDDLNWTHENVQMLMNAKTIGKTMTDEKKKSSWNLRVNQETLRLLNQKGWIYFLHCK